MHVRLITVQTRPQLPSSVIARVRMPAPVSTSLMKFGAAHGKTNEAASWLIRAWRRVAAIAEKRRLSCGLGNVVARPFAAAQCEAIRARTAVVNTSLDHPLPFPKRQTGLW